MSQEWAAQFRQVAATGRWDQNLEEGEPENDMVHQMEETQQDDARREEQTLRNKRRAATGMSFMSAAANGRCRLVVSDEHELERAESGEETEYDKEQELERAESGEETEYDKEQESRRAESGEETETEKEEEEESDTEEESFHFEVDNGWVAKRMSPEANGGLPDFSKGDYDKDYWNCTLVGKGCFVKMKDTIHGGEYTVPIKRVNKALRHLHLPSVAATLRACSGICRCKREPKCFQRGLDTLSILTHRHTYFQQLDEAGATKYLADLVRPHNTSSGTSDARPRFKWVLDGKEVCDDFFRTVFGISKDKLKGVRRLLVGEATIPAPRVRQERPRIKFAWGLAFWEEFFKMCQRPNNFTRLFPVNNSFPAIYEDYFLPWFKTTLPDNLDEIPCLGWVMVARHDPRFSDVKDRPKHHHCRCFVCANLQAQRLKAFNSEFDKSEYQREWQDHQNEKRGWRAFEQTLVLSAKHSPRTKNVYWFDDTEKTGFPKWTKRPMKNLPSTRFNVIPFLIADLARCEDFYVYTASGRFKKGANRLCTTLMAAFRATKNGTDVARHARELYLIADNFSENKNNTLLAFASDLVARGWYDEIYPVYGPPGHTHNGGDQQHQIHNEILGNFTSPTLVHFLARYPQAWRQEHTRPTPCVLDVQYDWDGFYKPFLEPIGGHTNTPGDPVGIRGFRIARGEGGVVAVQWKTKAESGEWRGADGHVGTPGFVVLKGRPRGMPGLIEPKRDLMEKKYFKQLVGKKMTECLVAEGATGAKAWLAEAAKHGVIPVNRRLQERGDISPGEFGSRVELKCDDVTAEVQLIEDIEQTAEQFWALPEVVLLELEKGAAAAEALSKKHLQHPAVGYASVPVARRPTYQGSAAEALAQEQERKEAEDSDDSDGSDESDQEEQRVVNNASRDVGEDREKPSKKRSRAGMVQQEDTDVTEVVHNVLALFGATSGADEVWLGILLSTSLRKKRIQFLAPVDGEEGAYILTGQTNTYPDHLFQHTFSNVPFVKTTTHKMTKRGQRAKSKSGMVVRVVTKSLDAEVLKGLADKCATSDDAAGAP
jgi:hypothetical protein